MMCSYLGGLKWVSISSKTRLQPGKRSAFPALRPKIPAQAPLHKTIAPSMESTKKDRYLSQGAVAAKPIVPTTAPTKIPKATFLASLSELTSPA
jgi:hypothetical protein